METKSYTVSYKAEYVGPPKRYLYLTKELPIPNDAPPEMVSGWVFVVDEEDKNGEIQPLWDTWEETYREIIRYPEVYAPKDITWVNDDTGEPVDIYNL
ncbi:hypothetical protein [Hyphococcus luteus]|uniref:hypothetical protein n=1 Tax=Hyphococcus luteus TaxID=2058213 RepID=UPI0010575EF3|nr:hypothetical protein [Marinicaulis flavus]